MSIQEQAAALVAAVGQLSVGKVHEQMRLITGLGAQKSVLVNGMLESVSAMGIQSRSAAMLNDIDPKQAREQIEGLMQRLFPQQDRDA